MGIFPATLVAVVRALAAIAFATTASAQAAWPMRGQNAQNTRRSPHYGPASNAGLGYLWVTVQDFGVSPVPPPCSGSPLDFDCFMPSAPVIGVNESVYFVHAWQRGGNVSAFQGWNGERLWTFPTGFSGFTPAVVVDDDQQELVLVLHGCTMPESGITCLWARNGATGNVTGPTNSGWFSLREGFLSIVLGAGSTEAYVSGQLFIASVTITPGSDFLQSRWQWPGNSDTFTWLTDDEPLTLSEDNTLLLGFGTPFHSKLREDDDNGLQNPCLFAAVQKFEQAGPPALLWNVSLPAWLFPNSAIAVSGTVGYICFEVHDGILGISSGAVSAFNIVTGM